MSIRLITHTSYARIIIYGADLSQWLSTEKAEFLNGKYIETNWSVEELVARKDEIVSEGKLSLAFKGTFGHAQFE